MKRLLAMMACCAAGCLLRAQGQEVDTLGAKTGYPNRFETVEVEGGVTMPLGNLKRMMKVAPSVGAWYRTPHGNNGVLSYGASVSFPRSHDFAYQEGDYRSHTKNLSGMVGVKLGKRYPISAKRHIDLEWTSVLGYGFYLYDDVKAREEYSQWPDWKKDKESKPAFVKPFSTFHMGQGAKLRIRDFGVFARYNYAPYGLFSEVISNDFGAHSVTVGVFYRQ